MSEAAELRERFAEFGQEHVFGFWDALDDDARARLVAQAASIDLLALREIHARAAAGPSPATAEQPLTPVPVERLPESGGDAAAFASARERGDALLAAGRVAALVVAGGQGSRLGFDGPKGAFPIGPVSDRTLFEIQAQKLRGLRRRLGVDLPWCVMTSPATDDATRAFFRSHGWFGLPESDVLFFSQGTIPSLDFDGKLILEAPDRIFENPDGHGGCLTALLRSGVLDALEARGIDTLFYYQVDNPLVRICDATTLGLHAAAGADVSCKVVRKTDPDEKVGIVARRGDRLAVVEYSELDDAHRHARDDEGQLVYWAGNIAIHVFDTGFVRRIAADAEKSLPFHVAEKQIPHVDSDGNRVEPSAPNGRKFERFVFDALAAAEGVCLIEADRKVEFSPVKNASGVDSAVTARRDLTASYRSWLAASGVPLPSPDTPIEIDHERIDSPDDILRLGIHQVADAGDAIRIASGDSA